MPGIGRKVRSGMRNFGDKIRTSVSIKKHQVVGIIALLVIVMLGLMLRLSPIFRAPPTLKEFDVWAQYNNVLYLLNNGLDSYYHWHTTQFWFPEGKDMWWLRPGVTFTAAFAYLFLNAIGIQVTVYEVCFYYPAVVGALEIIAMYYLGKEVLDSRTGLLAAFFLAFNPGHLQRSTAGFFDNEAIGVFAAILFFLFYIKAVKSGKFKHALMAGFGSALLALSWGASQYPLLLVPLIGLVFMLSGKFNDNAFMVTEVTSGVSLLGVALQPFLYNLPILLKEIDFILPLLFMFFAFIVYWFNNQKAAHPKFHESIWKIIKWGAIPVVILGAILLWGVPDLLPLDITGRIASILNPFLRGGMAVVSSVGEHMPSAWSVFYYNTLIPIFLIPVGIFFALKRLQHSDISMIVFILTLYFFTGSMVRIIMLFAPVAALVGAYGLSSVLNYFGTIGRKKIITSRRRRRQAKNTMGPEDTVVVFIFVGVLMIAQVVQTTKIAITQMSYSELIVGGEYQDWPEALTWMRTNLDSSTVVVSWWDYGYWCTVIGNVTTVNDNGTDNATRMGLTGMAMMQTDELASAKAFRALHAEYALVYWGFLIGGLGGDEGKWPWMLRICNEHTTEYATAGFRVDSGIGAWKENTVFDETEYYNSSSGLYEDKWFQSQLTKMMFYAEPTSPDQAQDQLGAYFAMQVAGGTSSDGKSQEARKTDNGETWSSIIQRETNVPFKCFTPAFFSSNRLVKIFKLDYTALDSEVNVSAPAVYDNGYGTVNVTNSGRYPVTLGNLTVGIEKSDNSIISLGDLESFSSSGKSVIQPGETITVWFNALQHEFQDLILTRGVTVTAAISGTGQGGQAFEFTSTSPQTTITKQPTTHVQIDRSQSVWWQPFNVPGNINLTVSNTGAIPVLISNTTVNGIAADFASVTDSIVILPGQSSQFVMSSGTGIATLAPLEIGVNTVDGASDIIFLTNNTHTNKISILPEEYVPLAEGIAQIAPPPIRSYIPVIPTQTVAWGNDTVEILVKNTGAYRLGLERVYLYNGKFEDVAYAPQSVAFTTQDGDLFLDPGETNTILTSLSGITPNSDVSVFITAIGLDGLQAATDAGQLKVIANQPQIQLLGDINAPDADAYGVLANANETVEYVIKNIGNESVDVSSVSLNSTSFTMTDGVFYKYASDGTRFNTTNYTLGIQEIGAFVVDTGTKGVRLNDTTTCLLGAVSSPFSISNITVQAQVPIPELLLSLEILGTIDGESATNCSAGTGILYVAIKNIGIYNITLNAMIINGTSIDILPANVLYPLPAQLTFKPGVTTIIQMQIGAIIPIVQFNQLTLAVMSKEGRLSTPPFTITVGA